MAFDVCSAAEDELFGGANVSLNRSIDLRGRDIDLSFRDLRAGADDERSIFRGDVAGEVTVDTQHRFEADFAGKIHDVADKAEPIIFIDIGPLTINERCHSVPLESRGRKKILGCRQYIICVIVRNVTIRLPFQDISGAST